MFIAAARRLPGAAIRYLIALAILGIASGITELILHTTGSRPTISVVFLLAVLASAWWGGFGPGVLATLLTLAFAPVLLTGHFALPASVNATQLVLVLLISILVSSVAAARNKVEAALRDANDRLDEGVQERTAELKRANQALQEREAYLIQQADELSRTNADLQHFAYVASHDLQEPLRAIAIYAELLDKKHAGQLDGEARKFIDVIVEAVRRMETLIRDVLIYSRTIHSDSQAAELLEASDAVVAATFNLEAAISQSGATIAGGTLPAVAFDRVQLVQVFQNLFSNAIKYRSAAKPVIEVNASRAADEWVFSVRDNGLGIHADYHETIFNPFKRLHGAEFAGTGVGLAICRRIIQRNGGRIWVESRPGGGSTFFFTVPDHAGQSSVKAVP